MIGEQPGRGQTNVSRGVCIRAYSLPELGPTAPVSLEKDLGSERRPNVTIGHWTTNDRQALLLLEERTWAPWLRKSMLSISQLADKYAHLQLKATLPDEPSNIVGSLSATRINWDGNPKSIEPWDVYAGGNVVINDYSPKYTEGNTICVMSSSVHPDFQKRGIATALFDALIDQASKDKSIKYIIGPFRPSGYGEFKLEPANAQTSFEEYYQRRDATGNLEDDWLRFAENRGFTLSHVIPNSMVVTVPRGHLDNYRRQYKPKKWKDMPDGTIECAETGSWRVTDEWATYEEPNVVGYLELAA